MGKKSRAKRERREQVSFTAALTACQGTWLEQPVTPEEQAHIDAAYQELKRHRATVMELSEDVNAANLFSIELFRDARFAPLQFDDWVVEDVLARFGEPPMVEVPEDTAFSDYLREAASHVASPRVRRALADQVRRFLPQYVEAGQIKEALAIDYNAYLTVMSDAITPLLVQMLLGALSRWYDQHDEDHDLLDAAPEDTLVQQEHTPQHE